MVCASWAGALALDMTPTSYRTDPTHRQLLHRKRAVRAPADVAARGSGPAPAHQRGCVMDVGFGFVLLHVCIRRSMGPRGVWTHARLITPGQPPLHYQATTTTSPCASLAAACGKSRRTGSTTPRPGKRGRWCWWSARGRTSWCVCDASLVVTSGCDGMEEMCTHTRAPRLTQSDPTYTHAQTCQQVQCPTLGAFPLTAVKDPRMVQSYMGKGTDFYEGTCCVYVWVELRGGWTHVTIDS